MSASQEPQVGDWCLVNDQRSGVGPAGSAKNHRFIVRDSELLRVVVLLRTGETAAYTGRQHPMHTQTCSSFDCKSQICNIAQSKSPGLSLCSESECMVDKCGVIVEEPCRPLNISDLGPYSCHETNDDTIEWLLGVRVLHQGVSRRRRGNT